MNFLYQIVTSSYVYTLYEEDNHIFLHVLNLRTEETEDFTHPSEILEILTFDPEVIPEDYDTVEILVSACKHC